MANNEQYFIDIPVTGRFRYFLEEDDKLAIINRTKTTTLDKAVEEFIDDSGLDIEGDFEPNDLTLQYGSKLGSTTMSEAHYLTSDVVEDREYSIMKVAYNVELNSQTVANIKANLDTEYLENDYDDNCNALYRVGVIVASIALLSSTPADTRTLKGLEDAGINLIEI